jgi:hypothetical protein
MAAHTFQSRVVSIRINTSDFSPLTRRIRKIGMAPEAEFATPVNREFLRVRWMFDSQAMAVFTLDDGMEGGTELLKLFCMAVLAIISPLIFHLEILPVFLTGFPIPAVHIAPLMNSEIFWHDQGPGG